MPWEHCGKQVSDDQRCPECGVSKAAWTVKLDRTRLFTLSRPWEGDAAAQADTLKRAAQDGTPFCEKCEKARQEAEAAAASAPTEPAS